MQSLRFVVVLTLFLVVAGLLSCADSPSVPEPPQAIQREPAASHVELAHTDRLAALKDINLAQFAAMVEQTEAANPALKARPADFCARVIGNLSNPPSWIRRLEDLIGDLTTCELELLAKECWNGPATFRARRTADQYTVRKYGKPCIYAGDTQGNAFKHAMWNIEMCKEIDCDWAQRYADAHECGGSTAEDMMDLNNNHFGRTLYGSYPRLSSKRLAEQLVCEDFVLESQPIVPPIPPAFRPYLIYLRDCDQGCMATLGCRLPICGIYDRPSPTPPPTPSPTPNPTLIPPDAINCPCGSGSNHGQYVSCVVHASQSLRSRGLITSEQQTCLTGAAAHSNCGRTSGAIPPDFGSCLGADPTPTVTPSATPTATPSSTPSPTTPPSVLQIDTLSPPTSAEIDFDLRIDGSGFDGGAHDEIYLGSTLIGSGSILGRSSTQVSVREFMLGIGPNTYTVYVRNGNGDLSNGLPLVITQHKPIITSLSPSTTAECTFDLTIDGLDFNDEAHDLIFLGSTLIGQGQILSRSRTQIVTRQFMSGIGANTYTVVVQQSGGTSSDGASLTVTANPPTITSISPTSVPNSSADFDLTVDGFCFGNEAIDQIYLGSTLIGNGTIVSRSDTRIVVHQRMTGIGPNTYTVKVKNNDELFSNGAPLVVSP